MKLLSGREGEREGGRSSEPDDLMVFGRSQKCLSSALLYLWTDLLHNAHKLIQAAAHRLILSSRRARQLCWGENDAAQPEPATGATELQEPSTPWPAPSQNRRSGWTTQREPHGPGRGRGDEKPNLMRRKRKKFWTACFVLKHKCEISRAETFNLLVRAQKFAVFHCYSLICHFISRNVEFSCSDADL